MHAQWSSPTPWIPVIGNKEGMCKPKKKGDFGDEQYIFCLLAYGRESTEGKAEENCFVLTLKCLMGRTHNLHITADMNGSRKICFRLSYRTAGILELLPNKAVPALDLNLAFLIRQNAMTVKRTDRLVRLWVQKVENRLVPQGVRS